MNVNERIARGLGWTRCDMFEGSWHQPNASVGHADPPKHVLSNGCRFKEPDYEHSLDALLEPLGVLRERGWTWEVGIDGIGQPWGLLRREGQYLYHRAATPSEALALAVADALEASK